MYMLLLDFTVGSLVSVRLCLDHCQSAGVALCPLFFIPSSFGRPRDQYQAVDRQGITGMYVFAV